MAATGLFEVYSSSGASSTSNTLYFRGRGDWTRTSDLVMPKSTLPHEVFGLVEVSAGKCRGVAQLVARVVRDAEVA